MPGYIIEAKEWFLRVTPIAVGSDRDRETEFIKQYTSGQLKDNYKMFLNENYPDQNVFGKLFDSVSFKLNSDDTAFHSQQGLMQKATDAKAALRDSSDNGVFERDGTITELGGVAEDNTTGSNNNQRLISSHFATCVLPHQLPDVQCTDDVYGTDTPGTPEIGGGIKITPISVALTTPAGKTRKNFKVEVYPHPDGSLDIGAIGGGDVGLKLKNDVSAATRVSRIYTGGGWIAGVGSSGTFTTNDGKTVAYNRYGQITSVV